MQISKIYKCKYFFKGTTSIEAKAEKKTISEKKQKEINTCLTCELDECKPSRCKKVGSL